MLFKQMFNRFIATNFSGYNNAECPNCWGYSQWADKDCAQYFHIDQGSSVEVGHRNGFIRRFVKRYLG